MSSFCISSLIFLLSLLPFFHQSSLLVTGDTALIQKTCHNTNYYDLCVASLSSDPNSLKADIPGLATIIVHVGIADTVNASSYLSLLLKNATDPSLRSVLTRCATLYSNTNTALQSSLGELASQSYDYASVHVSAAQAYAGSCHDTFKHNPLLVYPSELGRGEESVEQICDVALSILSILLA